MAAVVKDQPVLQLRTRSFPTRSSGERSIRMEFEFTINQPGDKGRPSIAAIAWSSGDIHPALAGPPPVVPPRVRRELQRLLRPWPPGRYVDAYQRTGGILNLFTPPWGEQQDERWHRLKSEWEARPFAGDNARQSALADMEQQWNQRPHPFFAGLTPAQVMVGGGPQEAALAEEFLAQVERALSKGEFAGEGDALIKALLLPRGWQVQPQRSGQTPMQIIMAERSKLLDRRARALAERQQ